METIKETGWNFDNSYASLPNTFYTFINPTTVKESKLIILNQPLATKLGLNSEILMNKEEIGVFAGNHIPDGAMPLAQAYAGHQYGHFTMLGDGRATLIGEQITPLGERFDIQLKGSGRTPYSRRGDGRASLGPMLREYIISEAMFALGIPTTRSLAIVTTGEPVYRETEQRGAILTRIASSHLRVGTFEYAANFCTIDELKALSDYTIERHYPHIKENENRYYSLLQEVIKRQAELIAKWQLVGFIHGVMNTDNMTISGETIDYGPCAFMNEYDPATVFSSIDTHGRYAYGNQPYIAAWNLARLAETLLPLFNNNQEIAVQMAQEAIEGFSDLYQKHFLAGMRKKLGIFNEEQEDKTLVNNLLDIMQTYQADFTNTFKSLTHDQIEDSTLFGKSEFTEWVEKWQKRLERQQQTKVESLQLMQQNNPVVIPRNHLVEETLEAAVTRDDYTVMNRLLEVLSCPFRYNPEYTHYYTLPTSPTRPYKTFCGT